MTLRQIGAVVVCAFALSISAAEATQRQKKPRIASQALIYCALDQTYRHSCPGTVEPTQRRARRAGGGYQGSAIVAHPSGCPRRLFCGCGVSVRVFGKRIRFLDLAANWVHKFPRTSPAAGMVAYRSRKGGGHVAYIKEYLGDGMAVLYDPNSGGGRTRVHTRSIAGWVVVNPHASRVAGL